MDETERRRDCGARGFLVPPRNIAGILTDLYSKDWPNQSPGSVARTCNPDVEGANLLGLVVWALYPITCGERMNSCRLGLVVWAINSITCGGMPADIYFFFLCFFFFNFEHKHVCLLGLCLVQLLLLPTTSNPNANQAKKIINIIL
jgi:hypothetical protein